MLISLIVFILIFGLLIFVHELGHFLMAKRAGIKVEEFAFGFPPRIFAVKKGETEYALNLIPFGGYVRMLGESEDASQAEKHNARSFAHQSAWTRAKVVVAGVAMNAILCWLLLSITFITGSPGFITDPEQIPYAKTEMSVKVGAVTKDSAAQAMGIKPEDVVVQFNETVITTQEQLAELAKNNKGQNVSLTISRGGQLEVVRGQLRQEDPALGVGLTTKYLVKLPFWWAPIFAVWETVKALGVLFVGMGQFFRDLVVQRAIPEEAAGPVGIFNYTRSIIDLGAGVLLTFMAMLSANLAVLNILPIPALDGGRLLFIILEKFNRGRKVINARIENIAHFVGFVLLILLIIAITYKDIARL